jgi:hypothetical protein
MGRESLVTGGGSWGKGYMANWGAVWRAAHLASVSARLFPLVIMEGRREASKTWAIKAALIMGVPLIVKSPLSFQIAEWDNKV